MVDLLGHGNRTITEKTMKHTLLLTTALFAAGNALADDPPPPGKLDRLAECRADVQKLCPSVQPGGGRIVACLKDNSDKVSDACKEKLQQMRQHRGNHQGGQPGNTNNN